MSEARRTSGTPGIFWAFLLALVLAGCGSTTNYANNPRPPAPIVVTGAIASDKISISPANFGAGPIELIVTNLTGASQVLTLETNNPIGSSPTGISQQTSPINPQDTASLKATLTQGTYSVHVTSGQIKPATLQVGPSRPSAQNLLLQP
jgi:hypothetical protein